MSAAATTRASSSPEADGGVAASTTAAAVQQQQEQQQQHNSPSPQSLNNDVGVANGSASRRVTIGTGGGDTEEEEAPPVVEVQPQQQQNDTEEAEESSAASEEGDLQPSSTKSTTPQQQVTTTTTNTLSSNKDSKSQDDSIPSKKPTTTTSNNNNEEAPPVPEDSDPKAQQPNLHHALSHPLTPNSIHPALAHPFPPGATFDMRRGSMNSAAGFMDDSFFRRPSLGFDMNAMDSFFSSNRRDSMDSSTAALDAAIMDLSRRRFSTLGTTTANTANGDPHVFSAGSTGSVSSQHESISQRQQQLQQQQRELEQRQRDLEYQRQQLIASMKERSYGGAAGVVPGTTASAVPPPYGYHHHHHTHHHRGSLGLGANTGGSLGLGSVHSQGSSQHPQQPSQYNHAPQQHRNSGGSGGTTSNQSWWVCQICNSKAFVSHEEAMQHESMCQGMEGNNNNINNSMRNKTMDPSMNPLPMHDPHMMRANPFITTDARAMSLGLGTMDNSSRGVVSMGMDSSRGGSMGFDSSRNMSLGMDSSDRHSLYGDNPVSMGPFAMLTQPVPLAMPSDKDWLTPLHCFVRQHCVEVFTASESDVATPSKGKRKPIQVGQIGIRCPHCHAVDSEGNSKARERGSVYYPTSISSIYNATMNLLQRHLHSCPAVPQEIMGRYETLKADDARSGTSKRYWVESARSLGLVDTPSGIRHSALRPPPLPTLTRQQESTNQTRRNSSEFFSSKSNAETLDGKDDTTHNDDDGSESEATGRPMDDASQQQLQASSALVSDDDSAYATSFSYHLLSQMQQCVFTEADRLGKRKGLPPGFPGLACRHCFGGYGSGRFFPSSIKTLSDTSKTLNVLYNHMMRCRKCPADIKSKLEGLRSSHDEERAKMKFGSQKAFFARIWERLHGKDAPGTLKRGIDPRSRMIHHHQQQQQQQQQQHHHPGNYPAHMQHHSMMHPHMRSPQMGQNGLEALAAVSTPSKRQKLEHSV